MDEIERVQKSFLHIALGSNYCSYGEALKVTNMQTLENRRNQLCLTFAKKAAKHKKHEHWFVPVDQSIPATRSV